MKAIRRIVLLSVVIYQVYGCASTPTPPRPQLQVPSGPISVAGSGGAGFKHDVYHIVGPSETLWRISKSYDVDIDTLMAVNNIADPTLIKSGQRLLIPDTYGARPMIPLYPNRRWTHIVIHHTATEVGNAFSIDKLHHNRGFWNGLGYHFLIDNGTEGKVDGQIEVGPRWIKQMVGAHANADGMNEKGIGISLVGNFSETYVTEAEMDSLVFLVKTLKEYYRIPLSNIIRHKDVRGKHTECPGNHFPWAEFKRRISS